MRRMNLLQLVERQEELNNLYVPGWRAVLTPAHYLVQCIDEASELFGSGIQYKWWKDVPYEEYDEWNAKIEMVDILFFSASIVSLVVKEHLRESLSLTDMVNYDGGDLSVIEQGTNHLNHKNVAKLLSRLVDLASSTTVGKSMGVYSLVSSIVGSMNFTPEEISAIYTAKYALNKFRISSGYKTGKYQKVVDGVEDNERLRVLVGEFMQDETMTLDDLERKTTEAFFALNDSK